MDLTLDLGARGGARALVLLQKLTVDPSVAMLALCVDLLMRLLRGRGHRFVGDYGLVHAVNLGEMTKRGRNGKWLSRIPLGKHPGRLVLTCGLRGSCTRTWTCRTAC